jgi:four helix bundle protein
MQKDLIDNNPILKLSFDFSLMIIDYCEKLDSLKKFSLSNQLFISGTSIGASSMEAQNAESKANFVHKMKIAAKESEETQYWLRLCNYAKPLPACQELLNKLEEIHKVLGKIISTAKRKYLVSYLMTIFFL